MLKHLAFILPIAAMSAATNAQSIIHESLTKWTRDTSASTWNANITEATAHYGAADELVTGTVVQYTGQTQTLGPGTYLVSARLMKALDQNGVADMTITVDYAGTKFTSTLPAANQATDKWKDIPFVTWTQTAPAPVTITIGNSTGTITKQNYKFDSVAVGHIEAGDVAHYQSLWTWNHVWGRDPRYSGFEVLESGSAHGTVNHLLSVYWLWWGGYQVNLAPGTYTANMRFKKLAGGTAANLDFTVNINGTAYVQTTRLAVDQPADSWVNIPAAVFTVQAGDVVKFTFGNQTGWKSAYHFDSLTVQEGAVEYYGQGCASSSGTVKLHRGSPAKVGHPFTMFASNMQNGFLGFGATQLNIDLSVIGMNGCSLLTTMNGTLPMTSFGIGSAMSSLNIPNNSALVGGRFFTQAVAIDPAANALGMVSSNAAIHDIVQ